VQDLGLDVFDDNGSSKGQDFENSSADTSYESSIFADYLSSRKLIHGKY